MSGSLSTDGLPQALFGAHTARAVENFDLGGPRLSDFPELLTALAQVKAAATLVNVELGLVPEHIGRAVVAAAHEVASGGLRGQFPIDVVQGGGGTSTNLNVNEVLASRAAELLDESDGGSIHPIDHVNRSQSTNDVLPTAMGIAVHRTAARALASLAHLRERLLAQAAANPSLEHLARTCLRDAVPIPVSDFHRAQAHSLARAASALDVAGERLLAVPLGATAVGTGIGAPGEYAALVIARLRSETGLDVRAATDPRDGLASLEPFVSVAEAMAACGRVMARIAADLRLLASGPVGGIGEIELPAVQAGSSIMPGKVNPVLPELVMQASYQLAGAAHTVRLAAGAGELEVSPMGPVVTAELLRGLERLGGVARLFADRCIDGLRWRPEWVAANLRGSLQDAVEAAREVGYDQAAYDQSAAKEGDLQ